MRVKEAIGVLLCWSFLITLAVGHSAVIERKRTFLPDQVSRNDTAESRLVKRETPPLCTAIYLIEPTTSFQCPTPSSLILTCRFFAPVNLLGEMVTISWFFSINMGSLNPIQQSVFNGAVNAAYESRIEVLSPSIGIYFCKTKTSGPIYRSEKLTIDPSIHCGGRRQPQPQAARCVEQGRPIPTIQPNTDLYLPVSHNFKRGTVTTEQPAQTTTPAVPTTPTAVPQTTAEAVTQTTASGQTTATEISVATQARNAGDSDEGGISLEVIIGAAVGGAVGVGVAALLIVLIIWRWKTVKRRHERQINSIRGNVEPLLTLPPSNPPPQSGPPTLNYKSAETIRKNPISPLPLPYEQFVANRNTGNSEANQTVKSEVQNSPPVEGDEEDSISSSGQHDLTNIYCRPKFYKHQAKRGRGFSTSTHIYGDLDFGTSAESNSYITTGGVSKAWARAKAKVKLAKEIKERELELENNGRPVVAENCAAAELDETAEEDYMDVIDFDVTEEGETQEYREEQEFDSEGEISESEIEDELDELSASQEIFKPKNPETGQPRMLPKPRRANGNYVNIRDLQPVDEVVYVNTRDTTHGDIKPTGDIRPTVPARKNKPQNYVSYNSSPDNRRPPKVRTRRMKRNKSSVLSGKYASLNTNTMDSTTIYSRREMYTSETQV